MIHSTLEFVLQSPNVFCGKSIHFHLQREMRIKRYKSVLLHSTSTSKINGCQLINPRRRSANYHPSIWEPKFIESLSSPYTYDFYGNKLEELKGEIRRLLNRSKSEPGVALKLIDSIQRLGVAYHFQEEIKECMHNWNAKAFAGHDLHTTALQFRLLREHGYSVSSEVFDKFRDGNGRFLESLGCDAIGLLSLYEASHLGLHVEEDLEETRSFSSKHLQCVTGKLEMKLAEQVQKSLEAPLHWRMSRSEARTFIDVYSMDSSQSSTLLELAKLDFNLVQSVYQRELKELARWWRDLGFREKLSFSRDRLMENYLWAMGLVFEPQFSKCRIGLTKFVCILSSIDDMYDVYGSLDELERFTQAVNRWEIKGTEDLPQYMKLCYLAMFNFGNEIAYDGLKEHGLDVLPYVRRAWAKLCESYLVEARWFYGGHKPTLDEYLENAWISVGGNSAIVHAYLLLGFPITNNSLDCISLCSQTIYWSSLITRLWDDLGTSEAEMARGDVTKSIQCYMMKEGASEEQAREHIKGLIRYSWAKLNEASARDSEHSKAMTNMSINMARTAQGIFQHGDGIGSSFGVIKDRLTQLIVTPIPIMCVGQKNCF